MRPIGLIGLIRLMYMKKKETGRTMVGKVVSTNMNKTVIVEVIRTFAHKLYKKTVRKSRRFAAHNEMADIKVGDRVKMQETVPMSKRKHFIVVEKVK